MKTFGTEHTYPATPEQVRAMLADPAFRERVAHAQGVVGVEVQVDPPDAAGSPAVPFTLVCRTEQDTSGLPAIARKFVGATTTSVVTETWHSPEAATVTIEAPGQPISSSGTVTLTPEGTGTTHTVEVKVTVKIPVVGGKLEALVVDALAAGYRIEHETGTAWLEGTR
ncbi:DUF2505 domain-containing protein [Nocardioides nanhaiensis]|uniref:DUF2505 domain-containing protein n=1 Tax=Nocardioides nanhaiensis TaxID=1476871 RepID=A0ABP8WZA8_9ACTN